MPRRDDTFILFYAEDFEEYETDNPKDLYCLSDSTVDIILSSLRFVSWPSRWRTDRLDNRNKVIPLEWDHLRNWGELAIEEMLTPMSCEINTGLESLATAIENASNKDALQNLAEAVELLANKQCCSDFQISNNGYFNNIVQSPEGGPNQTYGEAPGLELEPGGFPPNYDTENEYLLDKCRIANAIVDGWINSINNLATIGVVNFAGFLVVVVLALTSVILFPPSAFPLLFYALGAIGFASGLLVALAQGIQTNRTEIVCLLYNSDSVETILSLYADILDTIIGLIPNVGPLGAYLKTIAMLLANTETLNQLFSGAAAVGYLDAECQTCVCDRFVVEGGNSYVIEETEDSITVSSVDHGNWHSISIQFKVDDILLPCGPTQNILSTTLDGWSSWSSQNFSLNDGEQYTYQDEVIWQHPATNVRFFIILSSTPFTAQVTVEDYE